VYAQRQFAENINQYQQILSLDMQGEGNPPVKKKGILNKKEKYVRGQG